MSTWLQDELTDSALYLRDIGVALERAARPALARQIWDALQLVRQVEEIVSADVVNGGSDYSSTTAAQLAEEPVHVEAPSDQMTFC